MRRFLFNLFAWLVLLWLAVALLPFVLAGELIKMIARALLKRG